MKLLLDLRGHAISSMSVNSRVTGLRLVSKCPRTVRSAAGHKVLRQAGAERPEVSTNPSHHKP